jgi:hypothetical protein
MQTVWSKTIEQFCPQFKLTKEQIEDAFNKPDKTESVGGTYVTVKFYSGYAVAVTFFMQGNKTHFMNAYRIFPDMLTVDVDKAGALEILQNFMENYGMLVDVPGVGKVKTHVDLAAKKFFQGILDVEKYMQATGSRL